MDPLIRSEDLFRILVRLAGRRSRRPASDLAADELFVSEIAYRTYRRGRWKSFSGRLDGSFRLVDLAADPGELPRREGGAPGRSRRRIGGGSTS